MVRQGGRGGLMTGARCQDCGNQAKKECMYMRCRSCCKSKGFHCQTHVNSTWIPVYKRRRRHQIITSMTTQYHHPMVPIPTECINVNPSISSGLEEVNFPAEVNSTATFCGVRVHSAEDHTVDEHAYQTSVIIGGHVFKGILYDQGPDDQSSSSHPHQHHVMKQTNHNFINADAAAAATIATRGTVKTTTGSTSTAAQVVPPHPPNSSYPFMLSGLQVGFAICLVVYLFRVNSHVQD